MRVLTRGELVKLAPPQQIHTCHERAGTAERQASPRVNMLALSLHHKPSGCLSPCPLVLADTKLPDIYNRHSDGRCARHTISEDALMPAWIILLPQFAVTCSIICEVVYQRENF